MADLDDFFAKKDKKKSKPKKFLTTDEFVKKLDDTSKRYVEPSKPDSEPVDEKPAEVGDEKPIINQKEDEWKDFEEEQRKDYSGLKICQLKINNDRRIIDADSDDNPNDSDGNDNDSDPEKKSCPWKAVTPAEDVIEIPVEVKKPPANNVYIIPAMMNKQLAKIRAVKMNHAPDLSNAEYFPTLGAARPEEQKKKKNEAAFEEVRHGGRIQRVQVQNAAPVSVTNRFKSLEEDDS